ncbi:hypothetical protein BOW53_12655 [Solemya pervernicosa gill symbiont]|uniref:N-acetyltransferase domain-containing protein n=2 Tax=Gammaproteobacteria incertae sedis TaxID=118884 RepID=A0A1T2L2G9_9GAMM|nr:GNAT family N-acetyltransferase [Candidatus Reidiella endopervernicosa]OOZ39146.1 hypothetical protein BOW53_12655 [Solemya pervernicosa gill symbiont]QKQ28031.1 GNAT family N-acetyltransferase [Candidatus Reidiella endopervernicosa]
MTDALRISSVHQTSGSEWNACMTIYRATFPAWEREPEAVIADRLNEGSYQLMAGLLSGRVVGFYIQELNPLNAYVMFNYLAVDESQRNGGIGTLLCRDAMARFKRLSGFSWLLVEAEERQAIFYGRLGFHKLAFDYFAPRYDDSESVPMHLMVLPQEKRPKSIPAKELADIIRHLFHNGYLLDHDDPRVERQLSRLADDVSLVTWPHNKQ